MPCTYCNVSFSIIKWKTKCNKCSCNFCSNCIIEKRCLACHHVLNSQLQYDGLMKVKVKDLKLYSSTRGLPINTCKEKYELVNMILHNTHGTGGSYAPLPSITNVRLSQYPNQSMGNSYQPSRAEYPGQRQPQSPGIHQTTETLTGHRTGIDVPDPPNYTETQNAFATAAEVLASANNTSCDVPPNNATDISDGRENSSEVDAVLRPIPTGLLNKILLADLSSVLQIDLLTNRELKQILTDNFVDYKGCVEKSELLSRVVNLYTDRSNNIARQDESEESMCKICFDDQIDCVLLECGHMATCTACGKKLNECPICRHYIVRCVRVFKS